MTPLMFAVQAGKSKSVKYLLDHGADIAATETVCELFRQRRCDFIVINDLLTRIIVG